MSDERARFPRRWISRKAIFVNYRREDSGGYAARLVGDLIKHFGSSNVFRDVDSISGGAKFAEVLHQRLNESAVMLVVIGKRWSSIADEKGVPRLSNPDDWTRREVEEALSACIPVIPVLVGGAVLPDAHEVPLSLRPVLERHAVELRDGRPWKGDSAILLHDLEPYIWGQGVKLHLLRYRYALSLSGTAAAVIAVLLLTNPQLIDPADLRFKASLEESQTCFTYDAASKTYDAELGYRLRPTLNKPERATNVFLGVSRIYDQRAVGTNFDPTGKFCKSTPGCLDARIWDGPFDVSTLRDGTDGVVRKWITRIPAQSDRLFVHWIFYQKEGAFGARCEVNPNKSHAKGEQLPYVRMSWYGFWTVRQACDASWDSRIIDLSAKRPGRFCLSDLR